MSLFWSYHPSRCQEWLGCCRGAWHGWSVHDCAEPKPNIRAEVDLGFPITSVGDWGGNDLSVVFHTCGGVWLVVLAHHLLCTFSVGHFHICARLGGIYETVTDSWPLPPTWAGKWTWRGNLPLRANTGIVKKIRRKKICVIAEIDTNAKVWNAFKILVRIMTISPFTKAFKCVIMICRLLS